jgi:phage shock protein E
MKIYILLFISMFAFNFCEAQATEGVTLIDAKEFFKVIAKEDIQLIDVRTPKEFKEGHLENAINIHLYDTDFESRINQLKKSKPVYVYCKAGGRSAEAVEILKEQGFKTIVELKEGTESWIENSLPLVR